MTDSFFTDDSMLRRVHRETAVAFAGPRALLMQATHPVAFAGFFDHTGALGDPYARLRRTAEVIDEIAWGSKRRAEVMTRRVREVHATIRGELREPAGRFPAGTPYAADDPELLLWIIATLVDSFLLAYQHAVAPLTRDERDSYWQDYKVIARCFGLKDADLPATIEDFEAYMAAMLDSGDLHLTDRARELGIEIVMKPPVPVRLRPLVELVNQITVGTLPGDIRRMYGFSWDPARGLALVAGVQYAKRVLVPLLPTRLRFVRAAQRLTTVKPSASGLAA